MSFMEFFRKYPYFLFTFGGVVSLVAEAILQWVTPQYSGTVYSPLTIGIPHYLVAVAIVYDVAIAAFPLLISFDIKRAAFWGYLTAIFGAGGQYLNFDLPVSGVMFVVMLLVGLGPALFSARIKRRQDETLIA